MALRTPNVTAVIERRALRLTQVGPRFHSRYSRIRSVEQPKDVGLSGVPPESIFLLEVDDRG